MKIKITNTYAGRVSTTVVEIEEAGRDDIDDPNWWDEEVWPHTGDGHGQSESAWYDAEIIEAADESLVGQTYEWGG